MDPLRPKTAAVGIDLGTSNTVVAYVRDGQARAITDDLSKEPLIPSVCAFHPSGAVLVGREAKERRLQDPKNTVFSTKRLIGRAWGSKEIAQARARLPYELRQGKNSSVLVAARNKEFTLPEISAFVLRKAKAIADVGLKATVDRAVITCPANFDDLQRGATKLAGKLAGLEVLRVLNEPTAAALAYGYGKEGQERILVYDFGGGTFDVTILERQGDFFQVRATAGDSYLGGDDIDAAIANRIAEGFAAKHFYDPRADKQVFEHVREAAEKLKMKLSREERSTIELVNVAFGVGGNRPVRVPDDARRAREDRRSVHRADVQGLRANASTSASRRGRHRSSAPRRRQYAHFPGTRAGRGVLRSRSGGGGEPVRGGRSWRRDSGVRDDRSQHRRGGGPDAGSAPGVAEDRHVASTAEATRTPSNPRRRARARPRARFRRRPRLRYRSRFRRRVRSRLRRRPLAPSDRHRETHEPPSSPALASVRSSWRSRSP